MDRTAALVLALGIAAATLAPRAAAQPIQEHELTAAYVYNFAQLTEWPASALGRDAPFAICLMGRSAAGRGLEALHGKVVHNRRVEVRAVSGVAGARACAVLYIAAPERGWVAELAAALADAPVLTIADPDVAATVPVVVTLERREPRLGFHLNLAVAKRGQLRLSSRLRPLAISVTEAP